MRIRIATEADLDQLTHIHLSSATSVGQFLPLLGTRFLREYHRVLMRGKRSLVLCQEDNEGTVVGFISGTYAAEEHTAALRSHRSTLVLAALPALIRKPSLLLGMLKRFRSVRSNRIDGGYIAGAGCRLSYWGYLPGKRSGGSAIFLLQTWLSTAKDCGAQSVLLEVDESNSAVLKLHQMLGATVSRRFVTGDQRPRYLLCYELADRPTG
jgi:hypothetical protein